MTARDDGLRADLRALAEKWQGVLDECKAVDPRWILDRSVTTLQTALTEVRAVLDAHEPATEPEAPRIEDVLAAHAYLLFEYSDQSRHRCTCGWDGWGPGEHRAHVAQAIRETRAR